MSRLARRVVEIDDSIGRSLQKRLLDSVALWRPADQTVVPLADGSYAAPEMIHRYLNPK
jgi:hypothetical protein